MCDDKPNHAAAPQTDLDLCSSQPQLASGPVQTGNQRRHLQDNMKITCTRSFNINILNVNINHIFSNFANLSVKHSVPILFTLFCMCRSVSGTKHLREGSALLRISPLTGFTLLSSNIETQQVGMPYYVYVMHNSRFV